MVSFDPETGEIYVYCAPDAPSLPIWERVDVLKHLEATIPAPFERFQDGSNHRHDCPYHEDEAGNTCGQWTGRSVDPAHALPSSRRGTETWFRDKVSNITYRLIEYYGLEDRDIRWEVVPQAELSGKIQ